MLLLGWGGILKGKKVYLLFIFALSLIGSYIAINANPSLFDFSSKAEENQMTQELSFGEYKELLDARLIDAGIPLLNWNKNY